MRIVTCVEAGIYEVYVFVLARSIRRFAGELSDVEIVAVAPRKKHYCSEIVSRALSRLDVEVVFQDLNWQYSNYPLANKPFVLQAFQAADGPTLWLDSDTVVVRDLAPVLAYKTEVMACPVFAKGIGSAGPEDFNEYYWSALYELCGNLREVYCSTILGGDRIRAFYNTGVILSQSGTGLFDMWAHNLRNLLASSIRPSDGSEYMLEQSSFAATVLALDLKLEALPVKYNYPVHVQGLVRRQQGVALEDSVIWHHTNRFSNACHQLRCKLDANDWDVEIADLFLDKLIANPGAFVNKTPGKFSRIIQKIKSSLFGENGEC